MDEGRSENQLLRRAIPSMTAIKTVALLACLFVKSLCSISEAQALSCTKLTSGTGLIQDASHSPKAGSPVSVDENVAGLRFLDDARLVIYAVKSITDQLSSRTSPEASSPFRLQLWIVNILSGEVIAKREWGTRAKDSSVRVVKDGVVVKTGNVTKFYSSDLNRERRLDLSVAANGMVLIDASPSGKTLLINRIDQPENKSDIAVIDTADLSTRFTWSRVPALYNSYAVSDEGIAFRDTDRALIMFQKFGERASNVIGHVSGYCFSMNAPTVLEGERVAYGCDDLTVSTTIGQSISKIPFNATLRPTSPKISADKEGKRVALALDQRKKVRKPFVETTHRTVARKIAVYDITDQALVAQIGVEPLPTTDFDFAIAPSGDRIAILNDGDVSVCSTPSGSR